MNVIRALSLAAITLMCAAPAAPAAAQSPREAIDRTLPRMVKIYGAGGFRGLYAYGTGFLVSAEGHVATIWGTVLDADEVTVVLDDGRRFAAKLVGAEPQLDMAVLKIEGENLDLPHFDLDDLDDLGTAAPGTRILAFSNMFKVATGDEPVSVLHGVVAAKTTLSARRGIFEVPYKGPVYIVDAITNNPGAGGGVVTTRDGKLLGMIGKELRNAESNTWVNYAVPVSELKEAMAQIISGKYVAKSKDPDEEEGDDPARYRPLDFGIVMVPDVLYRTPAYVDSVAPDSHASRAGLRRDDLILFVNDQLVQSTRMLKAELGRLKPGDTLRVVVRRGGSLATVEMPVEAKAEP